MPPPETTQAPLPVRRIGAPASLAQAILLGGLGGAFVGALDALRVLAEGDTRYVQWAAGVVLVGVVGTGALGALLAVPAALLALVLHGRPGHRTAPPGVCAGLGTILGVGAFVFAGSFSMAQVVPLVVGGTLACLVLRELLGWWTLPGSATLWWALATLATAGAALWSAGAAPLGTGLAAGAVLCVLGARVLVPRLGHLVVTVGGSLLALASLGVLSRAPYPGPTDGAGRGPNVLHVSIDTLRADRVGCYGYAAAKTPTIDGLAQRGVLFEDTTAQANTTGPSHTTQLTGLYPAEHGALYNGRPLRHAVPTLPDLLADAGYDTAGFVSGFTLVDSACGLAPRFHWYADALLSWRWMPQQCERLAIAQRVLFRLAARRGEWVTRSDRPAGETVDDTLAWLSARPRPDAPFYAFVHFYDPHAPYEPPGEDTADYNWYALGSAEREELVADPARVARMNELYDGEVAYTDAQVARLLEALEASGQLDDTLVILTSDHGEGFGAHDYWFDHGTYLYDEELRVPLILRLPGGAHAGVRVAGQTRLLDLTPTVLDLLELEAPSQLSGSSLMPLIETGTSTDARPSFALAEMAGSVSGFDLRGRRLSLRSGGHKLVWTSPHWNDTQRVAERYELFALDGDPDELDDLFGGPAAAGTFEALREQLDAWRDATLEAGEGEELDPHVADHLRSLGYL